MTAAEATANQTNRKMQDAKKFFPSPLALYQKKFCRVCEFSPQNHGYCTPTQKRMLICVLTAMLDSQLRNNQLNQQRGAHY